VADRRPPPPPLSPSRPQRAAESEKPRRKVQCRCHNDPPPHKGAQPNLIYSWKSNDNNPQIAIRG